MVLAAYDCHKLIGHSCFSYKLLDYCYINLSLIYSMIFFTLLNLHLIMNISYFKYCYFNLLKNGYNLFSKDFNVH